MRKSKQKMNITRMRTIAPEEMKRKRKEKEKKSWLQNKDS